LLYNIIMSAASPCRSIWDRVKRNDCYQRESEMANKNDDVYGLNKYTKNIDKNSPLAKMSFEELMQHAKTHLGGKTKKRKIKRNILNSKSKKLLPRKKNTKRSRGSTIRRRKNLF
jgi:hypothetical protein